MQRLVAIAMLAALSGCSTTRYYIVRHAEKLDNSADPPLSAAGRDRAEKLGEQMADKKISGIFVSNLLRTKQTAGPTATRFNIEPTVVPARDTNELIERLKLISGEHVLVVRHSNELHLIVNALGDGMTSSPVGEGEYDNLFIVERQKTLGRTVVSLQRLKY
jgi:phosphohistidine phosphatase SixA